jgi:hypothetical protein
MHVTPSNDWKIACNWRFASTMFFCIRLVAITTKYGVKFGEGTMAKYHVVQARFHNSNNAMITNLNTLRQIAAFRLCSLACSGTVSLARWWSLTGNVSRFLGSNTHNLQKTILVGQTA